MGSCGDGATADEKLDVLEVPSGKEGAGDGADDVVAMQADGPQDGGKCLRQGEHADVVSTAQDGHENGGDPSGDVKVEDGADDPAEDADKCIGNHCGERTADCGRHGVGQRNLDVLLVAEVDDVDGNRSGEHSRDNTAGAPIVDRKGSDAFLGCRNGVEVEHDEGKERADCTSRARDTLNLGVLGAERDGQIRSEDAQGELLDEQDLAGIGSQERQQRVLGKLPVGGEQEHDQRERADHSDADGSHHAVGDGLDEIELSKLGERSRNLVDERHHRVYERLFLGGFLCHVEPLSFTASLLCTVTSCASLIG